MAEAEGRARARHADARWPESEMPHRLRGWTLAPWMGALFGEVIETLGGGA
jgi:hypothetical protein